MLEEKKKETLITLQCLRAIACINIVIYHSTSIFGGFSVDLFFVISGFVMAMTIEKEKSQSFYRFIIDRIIRIVPLYWILTTGVLLLTIVKPDLFNSTTFNISNYIKSLLFIPFIKESGLIQPLIFQGWTLNYELFFYACIWIASLINKKNYSFITFFIFLFITILSNNSSIEVIKKFYGTLLGFDFVLGIICFKIFKKNFFRNFSSQTLCVISFSLLIFMVFHELLFHRRLDPLEISVYGNNLNFTRFFYYAIPSSLLVVTITSLEKMTSNQTNNRLIKMIFTTGNSSYSIYLIHFFVIILIQKFLNIFKLSPYIYSITLGFLSLFLCIFIGYLVDLLIDKPITRWLKKIVYGRKLQI